MAAAPGPVSPMKDALWSLEFISGDKTFAAGVAIFENDRVFGGDSQYYFLGTYRLSANFITGDLEVTHYNGPAYPFLGRAKTFSLIISGPFEDPVMELQANVAESKSKELRVRLTRRAEWPS